MVRRSSTRRQVLVAGVAFGAAGCFPSVGGRWPTVEAACRDDGAGSTGDGGTEEGGTGDGGAAAAVVSEVHRDDAVTVDAATQRATVEPGPAREMIEAALAGLAAGPSPWRTLFPEEGERLRVGIKVNALNQQCPTSVVLVRALVDSLVEGLGVGRDRVIVWDRRSDELGQCGFTEASVGARVLGTIASVESSAGPGYGDPICGVVAGKAPRLSRILTDLTDVTINVPVLKTHAICGVTGAMKNVYGVIDNPGDYHANIATALPLLYRLPPIRRSFRLHVLDALVAVTTGGTSSPADTIPRRVAAAVDPVALDAYALALANRLRAEKGLGLPPVDLGATSWMENARKAGLGATSYGLAHAGAAPP